MEDLDLPEIKRKKVQERKVEDKKEFKDLFESDSDPDDDGLKLRGKLTLIFYSLHAGWSVTGTAECCDVLASRGLCFVAHWSSAGWKANLKVTMAMSDFHVSLCLKQSLS